MAEEDPVVRSGERASGLPDGTEDVGDGRPGHPVPEVL